MLRLALLDRVPNNAANLAWAQAPTARADLILSKLNYYHLTPENLTAVFGGLIHAATGITTLETDEVLVSNLSVVHRDVRTPQPLFFIHRVGVDPLTNLARYEIVNTEAAAVSLAEARLVLLRRLQITDQAGNLDRTLNWDLRIISKNASGRFIIDLYVDRLNDQGITFFLQYNAFDTSAGQELPNHREVINPTPIEAGQVIEQIGVKFVVTTIAATGLAPGIALFPGTGAPPTVEVNATGIVIGPTGIPRGLPIADLVATINDLDQDIFATPLSTSGEEVLLTGIFTPSTFGTVIRQDLVHIKYRDDTLVEVRPFRQLNAQDRWYARIGIGTFIRTEGSIEYIYSIPEFDDQIFSTRFGTGTYRETVEKPRIIGAFTLAVKRKPIFKGSTVKLLGAGGQTDITSLIKDVDLNNGFIYLRSPVSDDDDLEVSYAYSEDTFEYREIDLNPTLAHNSDIREKFVGIYIVPSKIRDISDLANPITIAEQDRTIFHVVADTVQGVKDAIEDPTLTFTPSIPNANPVAYRPILLAIVQPVQTGEVDQVKFVDTRTRGGGLDEDLRKKDFPFREGEMYWDIGFWEGEPFQESPVVIVDFPDELIGTGLPTITREFPVPTGFVAPIGLLSLQDIETRVGKYRAAGTLAILNPRQDLIVPTGVT